jgi:SAM-dependent methyltransferase
MLDQARKNLNDRFTFEVIDAQSIPFDDAAFDALLACHMLYHVPNRTRALAEINRVLKPGVRLFITTIGENHLRELRELVARFDPGIRTEQRGSLISFTLENGAAQLSSHFSGVTLRRYDDDLLVTDAELLAGYVLSSTWHGVAAHRRQELVVFVEQELAANDGAIHITKDSGLFVARRD